jgi:hypothetical protein
MCGRSAIQARVIVASRLMRAVIFLSRPLRALIRAVMVKAVLQMPVAGRQWTVLRKVPARLDQAGHSMAYREP